ncbi:Putrescine transport ATP-binding protein PotA (TC 3.A.1.11.1) [plant metagenome]|uniref:Putrescine transport ATP-binding protein PotA (TC 3.A.1.11.1) n=1 Tax=plant metagenome TaxID=1297885 RepID=A0A484TCN7_9ZZZZ
MSTAQPSSARRGAELKLEGISKFYGASAAVKDLDLAVQAGEFVTLLGASGSGKTTTLMMLAGFTTPSAGRITIGGRDVTALPPGKRDLGVVFQNYALFPHLTVAQNLAFPLEMRRMPRARIDAEVRRALELVQLADKGGRYPRELSGGQQQRIALARAIVFEPQALLMDEPLGALDKNLREHMQVEIKRLHTSLGATIVFVTHDQEEALTLSDRVAVMQDGRIAQIAPARDIYEQPASKWVAGFIGQSNFLPGVIETRDGEDCVVRMAGGERIKARGNVAPTIGQEVVGILRPERVRVAAADSAADVAAPAGSRLSATVIDTLYMGHTVKLGLQLADGTVLRSQSASDGHASLPAVGATVSVQWDPGSVWLVGPEGDA